MPLWLRKTAALGREYALYGVGPVRANKIGYVQWNDGYSAVMQRGDYIRCVLLDIQHPQFHGSYIVIGAGEQ